MHTKFGNRVLYEDIVHFAPKWSFKQTKYMVSVEDSCPVLFGNKVETLMPYLLSNEFVVDAKQDGEVVAIDQDYVIVKYKDGTNYAIDISSRIRKNAQAGFFVQNDLTTNLKVGDKFKKGDILAYNKGAFTPNKYNNGASMNLGVLSKIAITSLWDIYEDSAPITRSLAERLATTMIKEEVKTFNPNTYVEKIVKIGDPIKTGEPLIIFSQSDDEEFANILATIREDQRETVIESTRNSITSHYTGEIADITVYTTVPIEDLDPSLAKIVTDYHKRVKKRNAVLEKYKNKDDMNYYKAGQLITETDEVMKPSKNGKIKGEYAEGKVVICFYVKYRDVAAKGDKICAEFALKGVTSHVIDEGLEPYSEYRPEEEISTLVAPLAVAARKTPSIFLAMFTNKLIIEAKRQLRKIYLEEDE